MDPAKSAQRSILARLGAEIMAIADIPILSMLRTRLAWAQERQGVLAQNVANADTPHFRPRDLVPPTFDRKPAATSVELATTETGHLPGLASGSSSFRSNRVGGYDVVPSGNAVSLEDEMMKVAANQMDYQAAATLYSRSLALLKTAIGKP
jgi:flagellar basal-body rod protein FlgB